MFRFSIFNIGMWANLKDVTNFWAEVCNFASTKQNININFCLFLAFLKVSFFMTRQVGITVRNSHCAGEGDRVEQTKANDGN